MDRNVSVTAGTAGGRHLLDAGGFEHVEAGGEAAEAALESPSMHSGEDHGPCLFLGDAGERCGRRALEGGFCARHRPGEVTEGLVTPSRVVAASITILVLVWPYVADLVREIIHWMASH
jgi:hypothetical protein